MAYLRVVDHSYVYIVDEYIWFPQILAHWEWFPQGFLKVSSRFPQFPQFPQFPWLPRVKYTGGMACLCVVGPGSGPNETMPILVVNPRYHPADLELGWTRASFQSMVQRLDDAEAARAEERARERDDQLSARGPPSSPTYSEDEDYSPSEDEDDG
jgi:hypothetical protein